MKSIILASKSPRRKELMQLMPVAFEVFTKEVEERIDEAKSPEENVKLLAEQKAYAVAKDYPERWVVGCDTIVVYEGNIMGKPKDEEDAVKMLKSLQGCVHQVYTGVSLRNIQQSIAESFTVESFVTMKALSDEEIAWYVKTGEPMDKAGAYGIQGYASNFIDKIEGDYFNIVGLPVSTLYIYLKKYELLSF